MKKLWDDLRNGRQPEAAPLFFLVSAIIDIWKKIIKKSLRSM